MKVISGGAGSIPPDKKALDARRELVALGDKAVPSLLEMLRGDQDRIVLTRVMSLLVEVARDKDDVVAAARDLLERYPAKKGNRKHASVRASAARAIGAVGSEADCDVLLQLLDDSDAIVHSSVLKALARLGNAKAAVEIERRLELRRKEIGPEKTKNDYFIVRGTVAVQTIRARLHGNAPQ